MIGRDRDERLGVAAGDVIESAGQASDALTGAAGGGHSCGSTPQGEQRRNPGRLRTADQLDRTVLKEPTKSGDAHIWLTWVPEFA